MLKEEKILDVKINTGFDLNSAVEYIDNHFIKNNDDKSNLSRFHICTTNSEFIMDAQKDADFKQIINNCALSLPDGIGVIFALEYLSRIKRYKNYKQGILRFTIHPLLALYAGISLGIGSFFRNQSLYQRVAGRELAEKLCELSSIHGYSMFFLGGWPKDALGSRIASNDDMATQAARNMLDKYKESGEFKLVGATSQFRHWESNDTATIDYISKCMSENSIDVIDILFVVYGAPAQEKWIQRNANKLPVKVLIGLGGTFDYFTGIKKTTPPFFVKYNLDWLYRLITQPWRFKRIIKAFPLFPFKVFLESL